MLRTIWLMLGGILTVATVLTAIVVIFCIGVGSFLVSHHRDAPGASGAASPHAISSPISGPAKHTAT